MKQSNQYTCENGDCGSNCGYDNNGALKYIQQSRWTLRFRNHEQRLYNCPMLPAPGIVCMAVVSEKIKDKIHIGCHFLTRIMQTTSLQDSFYRGIVVLFFLYACVLKTTLTLYLTINNATVNKYRKTICCCAQPGDIHRAYWGGGHVETTALLVEGQELVDISLIYPSTTLQKYTIPVNALYEWQSKYSEDSRPFTCYVSSDNTVSVTDMPEASYKLIIDIILVIMAWALLIYLVSIKVVLYNQKQRLNTYEA